MVHRACQYPEEIFRCPNEIAILPWQVQAIRKKKIRNYSSGSLCFPISRLLVWISAMNSAFSNHYFVTFLWLTFYRNYCTFYSLLMITYNYWYPLAFPTVKPIHNDFHLLRSCQIGKKWQWKNGNYKWTQRRFPSWHARYNYSLESYLLLKMQTLNTIITGPQKTNIASWLTGVH